MRGSNLTYGAPSVADESGMSERPVSSVQFLLPNENFQKH
jgi:hypothetical protein